MRTCASAASTEVSVTIAVGGAAGTRVALVNGDRLTAAASGRAVVLAPRDDVFGNPSYFGTLPIASENVAFLVDYLRGDTSSQATNCGNTSAVGSSAIMTKPFEIEPVANTVKAGSPFALRWTNASADPMQVSVAGPCIAGGTEEVVGAKATTIRGAWLAATDPEKPEACTARVIARRCRSGRISPSFGEGGAVEACQERSLSFRVAP
jgi:hypothetical protein